MLTMIVPCSQTKAVELHRQDRASDYGPGTECPSTAVIANQIKTLRTANTIEQAPQRTSLGAAPTAEEAVTARILKRRKLTGPAAVETVETPVEPPLPADAEAGHIDLPQTAGYGFVA